MAKEYITLKLTNLFSFKCPIFDTAVQMRGCIMLRDKVYRGERVPTRLGCQACVSSSKCPAAELVRRMAFGSGDATDHCGSEEAVVGKLPADVLERIHPVLVKDSDLARYNVPASEREMIATANARIEAQMPSAPRQKVEGRTRTVATDSSSVSRKGSQKAVQRGSVSKAPETTTINKAAVTGDLTAAINAA